MTRNMQTLQNRLASEIQGMQITAHKNPAIALCWRAWLLVYSEARLEGRSAAFARTRARLAYRAAMPALSGCRRVRDFIACTTHGLLLEVIDPAEASKLLYAAQVAHMARRDKTRTKKTVQEPVSAANEPFSNQPCNS